MKKYNEVIFPFLFILVLSAAGCSTGEQSARLDNPPDGEYDTNYPSGEASGDIEKIGESVKLVNCLVFYKQYHFTWDNKITDDHLTDDDLLKKAWKTDNHNRTSSGTATIIGRRNNKLLFLTNAHIVHFPDTLISYFSNDSGKVTGYIESVHIKRSQTNYAALVGVGNLEIVHIDNKRDVALLGCEITRPFPERFSVFNYKIGDSNDLRWGDFVYVLGYPMHYKMLTTGVVSIAEGEDEYFMLDVNVNRGASGGIVMAIRDGIPNFELVGIISLVPAEKRNILIPRSLLNYGRYQVDAKYKGEIVVGEIENVKYGVARVVSIEAVKNSIREGYSEIIGNGYSLNAFDDLFNSEKDISE